MNILLTDFYWQIYLCNFAVVLIRCQLQRHLLDGEQGNACYISLIICQYVLTIFLLENFLSMTLLLMLYLENIVYHP